MRKLLILATLLFSCSIAQADQPNQNNYNFYIYKPNMSITGVLLPQSSKGSYTNYNSRLQYYQRSQIKKQEYYKKLHDLNLTPTKMDELDSSIRPTTLTGLYEAP